MSILNKRYWLFAGSSYYPRGGLSDLVKVSDNIDELTALLPTDEVYKDIKKISVTYLLDEEGRERSESHGYSPWAMIYDMSESIPKAVFEKFYG